MTSTPKLISLSLGAGIQSTTLALMAAEGAIKPMPDCAIFADTGWEPKSVYDHLEKLESILPFPVHHVSGGNILEHIRSATNATGQRFASIPWFTGNGGMGRRQCTREFKIDPIQRKLRSLLGYQPRERIPEASVQVGIGITTDEASRIKPAQSKWQINRWPLIELGMSRWDCIRWLHKRGWTEVPKSACIGCPYHSNQQWRELRDNDPDSWEQAVETDRQLRENGPARGMNELEYMHRDCVPLDEVDLRTDFDRGQINLFENECEGMCGL